MDISLVSSTNQYYLYMYKEFIKWEGSIFVSPSNDYEDVLLKIFKTVNGDNN